MACGTGSGPTRCTPALCWAQRAPRHWVQTHLALCRFPSELESNANASCLGTAHMFRTARGSAPLLPATGLGTKALLAPHSPRVHPIKKVYAALAG